MKPQLLQLKQWTKPKPLGRRHQIGLSINSERSVPRVVNKNEAILSQMQLKGIRGTATGKNMVMKPLIPKSTNNTIEVIRKAVDSNQTRDVISKLLKSIKVCPSSESLSLK